MAADLTNQTNLRGSGLLVLSDLDATLLDNNYRWDAAAPAVESLRSLDFPLVLSSSKTLDEMKVIASELRTGAPLICENGGIVAIPSATSPMPYTIDVSGHDRDTLLQVAHDLRTSRGYQFEGFADWTKEQICAATGLEEDQAERAMNRRATEPILWKDDDARWSQFEDELRAEGINTVQGGRFIHLVGNIDKANGMARAVEYYRAERPAIEWTTVALGDSPNDLAMLSAADIAIVIPNPHHGAKLFPDAQTVIHADQPGPIGWNSAMANLLDPYLNLKRERE